MKSPYKANEEVGMVEASHQEGDGGFHRLEIFLKKSKKKKTTRTFGWFPNKEEARSLQPTTASTNPTPLLAFLPFVFLPGKETIMKTMMVIKKMFING